MPGPIKQLSRHHLIQFIPAIKPVGLEMLSAIDAAVVGVLKEPGFECSPVGIELVDGPKDIQEDFLDRLLCFPVIVEDCPGDAEDQLTMSFKENGEGII